METKDFANIIKEARAKEGLTQRELAEKSGVKYSTLVKIETGVIKNPRVMNIIKLQEVIKLKF